MIMQPSAPITVQPRLSTWPEWRSVQFLAGLMATVLLPMGVVAMFWSPHVLWGSIVRNSAVASGSAFIAGWLWYRRLIRHPGVQGFENVLTAFIVPFGLAAAILLLARFEYTRVYLTAAFLLTIIAFVWIDIFVSDHARRRFSVVPFGAYRGVMAAPGAQWAVMAAPTVPARGAVTGLVADLRADLPDEWVRMLADAVLAGVPVFHVKQIEEALSGKVDIEHMSENHLGSLLPSLGYRRLKALTDFAIAMSLMPVLLPVFAIVAVAIRLDSPGPVFFRQQRVGFRGRVFNVIKFRTMRYQSPTSGGEERERAMTLPDDARITRVGRFLRRSRLDELPQVFNVLRGQMSWVGPRPEAMALSQWYDAEIPFYSYRHIVKPGVTGWAQVNQGHVTNLSDVHDKLRFDFYYIKYFSTWLDLLIFIRTARIIFNGFGAK